MGALAGLAGASLSILYLILEGPAGLEWGAAGSSIIGMFAVSAAAVGLTSADGAATTPAAQKLEEASAGLSGLVLPLSFAAALMSVYTALHGVTWY